ncbi:MAG TPA: hypothetical protein VJV74_05410 [Terriglobia bacterium]|nr:hypothetical protein [Terriglobia bacterium]
MNFYPFQQWLGFTSTRLWIAATILGSIGLGWQALPDSITSVLPPWFHTVCAIAAVVTGAAGLSARAVKAPPPPEETPKP